MFDYPPSYVDEWCCFTSYEVDLFDFGHSCAAQIGRPTKGKVLAYRLGVDSGGLRKLEASFGGILGQLWDIELLLSRVDDDATLSILSRVRAAIELIERAASFEGDGDLGAAHLVLNDVARDLVELHQREEPALPLTGIELHSGAFKPFNLK